jgi:hypothetical protein
MNLEFIKDLDYEKYFNQEELLMVETIGLDNTIKLYEKFIKTTFYFSSERINAMRKEYVKKMHGKCSVQDLVRQTGYSERTIYNIWSNNNMDNLELFEDNQTE